MESAARPAKPLFRTPQGRADYYRAYDKTLSLWPVPYQEENVPTRFGSTHVIISGGIQKPPLILLHGAQASSTMWFPNIAAFCAAHRVYAIDFLLEAGKSVPTLMLTGRRDLTNWLLDVLDHYRLGRPPIVGMSRGGWNAMAFCMECPERVEKLVLLSPAQGITPITNGKFLMTTIFCSLFPSDRRTMKMAQLVSVDAAKIAVPFLEQYGLALRHFNIVTGIQVPPALFTDQELRSIPVSTLLLIGDSDIVNNGASVARAQAQIPNVAAETVANAGHFLTMDQPRYVNERIVAFLDTGGTRMDPPPQRPPCSWPG